ncbi:MAG: FHA domain-containing protein [Acidobacteriota bacterium]
MRQLLARLGEKLGELINEQQQATVHSALGRLLPVLQQSLSDNLRKDETGISYLAPHRLRILLDYDTYSRLNQQSLIRLKKELTLLAKQFINDRRYRLAKPLSLTLTYGTIANPLVRADFGNQIATQSLTTTDSLSSVFRLHSLNSNLKLDIKLSDLKKSGDQISIGRARDNSVVLNDESVSKFHARLILDEQGRLLLVDCGSTNGTFLNGLIVSQHTEVKSGDRLGFGDVELQLEEAE